MDKAKTLPRSKRDKSPSPSSSSFSSLKNATVLKINSFRHLKSGPLMKGKKKKKDGSDTTPLNGNTLNETPELNQQVDEPDAASTPIPQEIAPQEKKSSKKVKTPKKSKGSKEPEPTNPPVTETPSSPTAALDAVIPTGEKLKNPKKPKPPIKKIVKSGRGILTKFKGKNESAPIMVDTSLDARRTAKKPEDEELDPAVEEELKNGDIGEITVTSKDEWSTTATCEKVRKLSRLEIQQSVYDEEVHGEGLPSPTTPEDETFFVQDETQLSSSVPNITANGDSPINFDKKSPSTIKKEILSSINSSKIRKTSDPIPNGSRSAIPRKISMQARNPSDKNELLFKILVIGELGTGKTSIIKRYVHQFFSQHYRATIGVDFALKVLQWDNETMIRLQLWDIAGQERFGNMTRVYYKEAVGAFIVFDVTRVGTFEAVTKWKQDLDAKVQLPDGESIPCVLLANKCDQSKEGLVNSSSKMDEFCKENQFVAWFETSAKENINIDEAANGLVAKIVQNDQKRLQEKETTNGTGVININVENSAAESAKNKFCSAC